MGHYGLNHLSQIYGSHGSLINFLSIVIGLVTCFLGYRVFKLYLALIGFLIGYFFGAIMGGWFSGGGTIGPFIGGCFFGLVVGGIAFGMYLIGIFLMGASFSAGALAVILTTMGVKHEFIILVIIGILGGIVAVRLQRFFVIMCTAFSGAWGAVVGFVSIFLKGEISTAMSALPFSPAGGKIGAVILLASLLLGTAGMVAQFRWFPEAELKGPR